MAFDLQITNRVFRINLNGSFRNRDWGNGFGVIQEALDQKIYEGTSFNQTEIFFHNCSWVDPIPLLSLLISLNEFSKAGGYSTIVLPTVAPGIEQESDKVVKFLFEEGFLDLFANCCNIVDHERTLLFDIGEQKWNEDEREKISQITSYIYYTNTSLLNAAVIDTKNLFRSGPEYVDQWVEKNVQIVGTRISDKIPSFSQNAILHRLTIVLVELIQNIAKHAYENSERSFAGVYLRFRNGLDNNSLSSEERKRLMKALADEHASCPRLSREFLDVRKGCIEIFVVDSGHGFTETLRSSLPKKNLVYPFREAYDIVFEHGRRRAYRNTPDSTFQGGLFYIGQMLEANQDYICGRDENEWVGGTLPISRHDFYETCFAEKGKNVQGLSWIVRLSWRNETEYGKHNWSTWPGVAMHNPIYKELEENRIKVPLSQYPIYDYRFDQLLDTNLQNSSKADRYILLLPPINQTKSGIWKLLNEIADHYNDSNNRVLFICDITEYEKQIYIYALHRIRVEQKRELHWINKFSKIVLVSRRLSHAILVRSDFTYHLQNLDNNTYFEPVDPQRFSPADSLVHLVMWLKSHDSLLFWNNIKKYNSEKQFYVNGIVGWSEKLPTINGYLDFAQVATDSLCKNIFRVSLERVVGLFGDFVNSEYKYCRFVNIDVLTKAIADESNATFFNETSKENLYEVYMGSVFVSGESKEDAMYYLKDKNPNVIHVHFLQHKSSKTRVPHLINWPKEEWLEKFEKSDKHYERVGRTHVIAEYGYKSFTIPRFMSETKESAYFRNPRSTYKDWQNEKNQIISFGHFDYEGKHDLFKVNVMKLIDESFLLNNELSKFLVSEFFVALGGKGRQDLSPKGQVYFDTIIEYQKSNSDSKPVALIAYPNNSNSAYIIDKIKELLNPTLTQRIFALMPINKERVGSSLLISPLAFDRIKDILIKSNEKRVLLFDSTVISGRTRKELKHLLFSLGASELKTLSITDRFRLPFRVPDKTKHKSYWRLDLPLLGTADMCPICKAIELVTHFKKELASQLAIERISEWIDKWEAISFFHPQSDHGIRPTPITPMEKKFGIEFDAVANRFVQIISDSDKNKDVKNSIEITNSLGLTLYTTEVHAMTSRDDLALQLINQLQNLSPPAKIELLSAQLLLFPNEYAKHIQFEMVLALFNAANELHYPDNWTALAALVLIIQSKEVQEKLVNESKREIGILKINNRDLHTVLAYILKYSADKDLSSEKIERLLKYKDEETLLSLYKQFHYEIYADAGEIHSKPLVAFYVKKEINPEDSLPDAINSISKLSYTIKKIERWRFRSSANDIKFPQNLKENCLELLDEYYRIFRKLDDEYVSEGRDLTKSTQHKSEFNKIKNNVRTNLVSTLQRLHDYLFCSLFTSDDSETNLVSELNYLINSISNHVWRSEAERKHKTIFQEKIPQVKLSSDAKVIPRDINYKRRNAWVVIDDLMESEIGYLLTNAVHSVEPIPDIWSVDANDTTLADMWINVKYSIDEVEIIFANASAQKAAEVERSINEKKKEGLIHLVDSLKGKIAVEYFGTTKNKNEIIMIILKLPTI